MSAAVDHPDIAAAPTRGPRCKFGRQHHWFSFARDGEITDDVWECHACGAIADDREAPASGRCAPVSASADPALNQSKSPAIPAPESKP